MQWQNRCGICMTCSLAPRYLNSHEEEHRGALRESDGKEELSSA